MGICGKYVGLYVILKYFEFIGALITFKNKTMQLLFAFKTGLAHAAKLTSLHISPLLRKTVAVFKRANTCKLLVHCVPCCSAVQLSLTGIRGGVSQIFVQYRVILSVCRHHWELTKKLQNSPRQWGRELILSPSSIQSRFWSRRQWKVGLQRQDTWLRNQSFFQSINQGLHEEMMYAKPKLCCDPRCLIATFKESLFLKHNLSNSCGNRNWPYSLSLGNTPVAAMSMFVFPASWLMTGVH